MGEGGYLATGYPSLPYSILPLVTEGRKDGRKGWKAGRMDERQNGRREGRMDERQNGRKEAMDKRRNERRKERRKKGTKEAREGGNT